MEEDSLNRWNKCKQGLLNNLLTILLVSSVVIGVVIGILIRTHSEPLPEVDASFLGLPGEMLIRILKCSATPLILACVVVALGSLDLMVSKRICWQLVILVFGTKFLSACVGLTAVLLIHPGKPESVAVTQTWKGDRVSMMDIFLDMFRNIITGNMIRMYLEQSKTELKPPGENRTDEEDTNKWIVRVKYIDGMNMLGIIFVSIIVGLGLAILQDRGKGLYNIAETVYDISINVATWVLWLSPGLIFFLILSEILKISNFAVFAATWGKFLLTTHAGFLVVFLIEYPLLVFILTRENPFKLIMDVGSALVTAYATASSMATMPLVIEGLIKNGVDPRLVRFLVPVGVNINKDGATNFLVCATVFVAQMLGESLSWGHYISILILSAMGSMAAASVPFSIIVVLVMVLNGLGLKQNLVGGILAVEWINDRAATTCNIFGNCCQPKIIAKWNKKYLEEADGKGSLEI